MELRLLAIQMLVPMQFSFLNASQMRVVIGISPFEPDQYNRVIDKLMDNRIIE